MTLQEDIQKAIELLEEARKNMKPSKSMEVVIFIRDIPTSISEDRYVKYFRTQVEWLQPELMVECIKNMGWKGLKERSRPRMYC